MMSHSGQVNCIVIKQKIAEDVRRERFISENVMKHKDGIWYRMY